MITRCGKQTSKSGKPFTEQSVKDHELQCVNCSSIRWQEQGLDINGRIKPLCENIADDDEPDGAYWAMKLEGYID